MSFVCPELSSVSSTTDCNTRDHLRGIAKEKKSDHLNSSIHKIQEWRPDVDMLKCITPQLKLLSGCLANLQERREPSLNMMLQDSDPLKISVDILVNKHQNAQVSLRQLGLVIFKLPSTLRSGLTQERRHRGGDTALEGVLTMKINENDRMPGAGLDEWCALQFECQSATHLLPST